MARRTRNSTTYGLALQLMIIVAVSRIQIALELFYIILAIMVSLQALFYWRDNPTEPVIDTQQYEITEAPRQVLMGFLMAIPIVAPIVIFGRHELPGDLSGEFTTQGLFVGFTETLYMIVTVRTLWIQDRNIGIVAWPPLFGFVHPAVREAWVHGQFTTQSFVAFGYATMFGIFFWILWELRTSTILSRRFRRFFGAVTSWTAHVTINMFIIAFPLSLFLLDLFPLVIGHG